MTTTTTEAKPGTDVEVSQSYSASMLPADADSSSWTPQQHALMAAAGAVKKQGNNWVTIPRPDAEAFLYQCRRTGLDPIARQIYTIERSGKYGIQISIDGARLVAQRSGEYRGQTPKQWTDGSMTKRPLRKPDGSLELDGKGSVIMVDDYLWVDVWLHKEAPKAARVGVYREGFAEPVFAVANWDAYRPSGKAPMWEKMPALMLAKCAEMLALRIAFPQELSGLYSTEEMEQAGGPRPAPAAQQAVAATQQAGQPAAGTPAEAPAEAAPVEREAGPTQWERHAFSIRQLDGERGLRALFKAAQAQKSLGFPLSDAAIEKAAEEKIDMGTQTPALGDLLMALSAILPELAPEVETDANPQTGEVPNENIVDAEVVTDEPPAEVEF